MFQIPLGPCAYGSAPNGTDTQQEVVMSGKVYQSGDDVLTSKGIDVYWDGNDVEEAISRLRYHKDLGVKTCLVVDDLSGADLPVAEADDVRVVCRNSRKNDDEQDDYDSGSVGVFPINHDNSREDDDDSWENTWWWRT